MSKKRIGGGYGLTDDCLVTPYGLFDVGSEIYDSYVSTASARDGWLDAWIEKTFPLEQYGVEETITIALDEFKGLVSGQLQTSNTDWVRFQLKYNVGPLSWKPPAPATEGDTV